MLRKLIIDASICREPASGVHLAVRHGVEAELTFSRAYFTPLLLGNFDVPGVECMSLPKWTKPAAGRIFWQQFFLPSLLRHLEADLLHANAYTMPLRCSLPTLLNVHDIIALDYPHLCSLQNVCHIRTLLPGSIRRATKCLVPTRYVGERMQARLAVPFAKIEVAAWGVDFHRFDNLVPLADLQLPTPYFLFVGNIEPKKNLALLLQAYASIASRCRCALLVVGRAGWKCRDELQALRNWKGAGKVCWLGRLPDEQLTAVYQQATAFVMPSIVEGFGLPVLEAMAAGVPVLHSKQAALMEVAGGAGLAFAPDDSEGLAKLMMKIAESDAARKELAEAGKKRAKAMSWQKYGKLCTDLLRSI